MRNPITLTFVAIAIPLFLVAVVGGMAPGETVQLLFAPYSYDFSRGVGKSLAGDVAIGLLGLQVVFVSMLFCVPGISNVLVRRSLWGLGITLVVLYFAVMLLAFVTTGIH